MNTLQKKKPVPRAANRAGQSLMRQLDEPDDVEAELDKLSDDYYDLVDTAKEKLKTTKETVKKVKEFVELIEIIEVWIIEVVDVVTKLEAAGTDPDSIKKQVKEIDDLQSRLAKYTVKIKV